MKKTSILAISIVAAFSALSVQAQTYQWKNSQGQTVISDTPPPGTAKTSRTIGINQGVQKGDKAAEAPAEPDAKKPPPAPKTFSEKDAEFKKRQQEAKEKADKAGKEQAAAKDKQENCERARRNLATLESSQPMATTDEKGQRQIMDQGQRDQEMERVRRFVAESCN